MLKGGLLFLWQCLKRGRASCPRASEGQGRLSKALGFPCAWFLQPPVVTRATDINTDPAAAGPQTQTWPTAAVLAQPAPWPWVSAQATQIFTAPSLTFLMAALTYS